jgi:hypothetical protein
MAVTATSSLGTGELEMWNGKHPAIIGGNLNDVLR